MSVPNKGRYLFWLLPAALLGAACGDDGAGGGGGSGNTGNEGGGGTGNTGNEGGGGTGNTGNEGGGGTGNMGGGGMGGGGMGGGGTGGVPNCADDQFECADGFCIPAEWECDGVTNCLDGTDEDFFFSPETGPVFGLNPNCAVAGWTCPVIFYGTGDGCDCGCGIVDPDCAGTTGDDCDFCNDVGSCSSGFFGCPGIIDPADNSACTTCDDPTMYFQCGDGACAALDAECNFVSQCADGSDEYPLNPKCDCDTNAGQFECADGTCTDFDGGFWSECDGIPNCADGSDEYPLNAACCDPATEAQCDNGTCIAQSAVCDGTDDCGDGQDESEVVCEWFCDPFWYGEGFECDCGCGAVDPDCADATSASCDWCGDGCAVGDCTQIDAADNSVCDCDPGTTATCVVDVSPTKSVDFCAPNFVVCDGFTHCPGGEDEFPINTSCCDPALLCGDGTCLNAGEMCDGTADCNDDESELRCDWTCSPLYYGTNDGCDCGCGAVDPDCADATAAECDFCDNAGSCSMVMGCTDIDTNDNSTCM